VLTNLKTGHDAICRIVKVRPYAQLHSYVEIEFTHKQPGYWGVYFSGDSAVEASPIHAPLAGGSLHTVPGASVDVKIEKKLEPRSDGNSWAPAENTSPKLASVPGGVSGNAVPVTRPIAAESVKTPESSLPTAAVRPNKPESTFAPIGSQEEVQAAASSTNAIGMNFPARDERHTHAGEDSKAKKEIGFSPAVLTVASPAGSVSIAEPRGDMGAVAASSESLAAVAEGDLTFTSGTHERSEPAHQAPFGRFAAAAALGGAAETVHDGVSSYLEARKQRPSWLPMVLGVAALLITVVGGVLFFYLRPSAEPESAPVAVVPASSPTAAHNSEKANPVAEANNVTPSAPERAAVRTTNVPAKPTEAAPVTVSKAAVREVPQPAEPTQEAAQPAAPDHVKRAVKVPDMFGALNAHPVSPVRTSDLTAAPSAPAIDAMAGGLNGASGAGLSSSIVPVPLEQTTGPGRSGSLLKPPKLVSSVLPIYPQIAQTAGVQGDVIVQVSIDKRGNVSAAKVISGPVMLRKAALDAVQQWKYEPSILDGQAVATQTTVRILFHR
jgi:protein TonB